jgi:EmrB/QacA subfamily drug resistance transporter
MTAPVPTDNVKRLLPWLVAVAFFMESLDTTILNTAVPTIADALGVAPLSMKAALTSYTISLAVFIPVSGWIADRFGTRLVFLTAIGVFTTGSLMCGLSVNMPMLVASRILQGCGGALMMPVGRITMVRTFPKADLVRAMSFVAVPGLIGPLIGPLAGGLIVGYLHWRMIFFVNIPVGLAGMYLVYRHMPDYRSAERVPLDFVGLSLFGSGIALLSYVLEIFGEHDLDVKSVSFLLGLSVLLLLAYTAHALREEFPLLKLALFRVRTFRSAVTGSFATRLGVGGMPFLLPLLYQIGLGYTPVQSGLLIVPQPLAAMSLKMLMPRILTRFGYRNVLLTNTVAIGVVTILFMTVRPGIPAAAIVAMGFSLGFVSSMQYTSMNTLVFADLPDADASAGSSIASTVQQMSMSFGVAVASLLAAVFLGGEHRPGPAALVSGIHWTFLTMGTMTIVSALIFTPLKPGDGANISLHRKAAP